MKWTCWLLLLTASGCSAEQWQSINQPSACEPVNTADDILSTVSELSRGDAARLCFHGSTARIHEWCTMVFNVRSSTPVSLLRDNAIQIPSVQLRNITIDEPITIPDNAQLVIDCRGGAIQVLVPPTLSFGSLLGFSGCFFTSFRAGESSTAKPSNPLYLLNWKADNAMLMFEDTLLEQPCSVFDTYALMPLFAEGSPFETARFGPLVTADSLPLQAPNATSHGSSHPPSHASTAWGRPRRRLMQEPTAAAARLDTNRTAEPETQQSGTSSTGANDGAVVPESTTRQRTRAITYIELHLLAPLSDMVLHFDNVTTWGCTTSWEEDGQVIAKAALDLAQSTGPQPVGNTTAPVEFMGAAQALRGDISDTPWTSTDACRVCAPLPIARSGHRVLRHSKQVRAAEDASSGGDKDGTGVVVGVVTSVVAFMLLSVAAAVLARHKMHLKLFRIQKLSDGDIPEGSAALPYSPDASTGSLHARRSMGSFSNIPSPASESPYGHIATNPAAKLAQSTYSACAHKNSRQQQHAWSTNTMHAAHECSRRSSSMDAACARVVSTGVKSAPAVQDSLHPLRLPPRPDRSCEPPLSVQSGCGTPGCGASVCHTPYSQHANPPPLPAPDTVLSGGVHSPMGPTLPKEGHSYSPTTLSFGLHDHARHACGAHEAATQQLAWPKVDQGPIDSMHNPEAPVATHATILTSDAFSNSAFMSCNAEISHSMWGLESSSQNPRNPHPPSREDTACMEEHQRRMNQCNDAMHACAVRRSLTHRSAPQLREYSGMFSSSSNESEHSEAGMYSTQSSVSCASSVMSVQKAQNLPEGGVPVNAQEGSAATPAGRGSGGSCKRPGKGGSGSEPVCVASVYPVDTMTFYSSLTSVSHSNKLSPAPSCNTLLNSSSATSVRNNAYAACIAARRVSHPRDSRSSTMHAKHARRHMPRAKRRMARKLQKAKSDEPITAKDLEHLGSLPPKEEAAPDGRGGPDGGLSVQGNNQLRVFRVLGAGGFATVFHGEWRGLEVAIKKLDISKCTGRARARLAAMATEATIGSNLVHPNVVATYTHGLSTSADAIDHTPSGPGRPGPGMGGAGAASAAAKYLMVQEYCNGGSLRSAIVKGTLGPPSEGGLQQRWAPLMHVAKSITEGMRYMHSKGILHGDLNPANILLKVAGTPGTPAQVLKGASAVKITDFGLSHQLPNGAKFAADMCVGTPFFMAPEVLAAKHFYPASDVYSFGVIMWEIMSGSPVFVRPSAATSPRGSPKRAASPRSPTAASPPGSPPAGASPDPAAAPAADGPCSGYTLNPAFPSLPSSVPLAFSLALRACLHPDPLERPTFAQLCKVLAEVESEVSEGVYVNSKGLLQTSEAADRLPVDDVTDCMAPDWSFTDDMSSALSRRMLQSGFHAAVSTLPSGPSSFDDDSNLADTMCRTISCNRSALTALGLPLSPPAADTGGVPASPPTTHPVVFTPTTTPPSAPPPTTGNKTHDNSTSNGESSILRGTLSGSAPFDPKSQLGFGLLPPETLAEPLTEPLEECSKNNSKNVAVAATAATVSNSASSALPVHTQSTVVDDKLPAPSWCSAAVAAHLSSTVDQGGVAATCNTCSAAGCSAVAGCTCAGVNVSGACACCEHVGRVTDVRGDRDGDAITTHAITKENAVVDGALSAELSGDEGNSAIGALSSFLDEGTCMLGCPQLPLGA